MNFLKYKRQHDVGEVGLLVTLVLGLIFVVGFPPKDMHKHRQMKEEDREASRLDRKSVV